MRQTEVIPADGSWVDKDIREFSGSPVQRISDEWMLITAGNVAGDKGNWNTMTASWGGLGELWAKHVAFMFIRRTRHTFAFANENPLFTLSFFDKAHHKALEIAGAQSGRDIDKAAKGGLTPIVFSGIGGIDGAVGFKEAREIIICKKLYGHDFDPAGFLDPAIEKLYPQKDYHRMYIGEVLAVKVKRIP
jgi:flavin reductase (DIM6/NTAB) family NADH-FMN oxidoreductase RutF